ncbi:MAG: hypothetical protein CL878_12475 [Dehalococcoidia bacterium]|nr:hypothetical protein [Dehalococcoidia bacterium]
MDLRQAWRNRFRQLRWQLTLSYTGVTVAALVVVELLLLGGSTAVVAVLINTGRLPSRIIETAASEYVPGLRPYLQQVPPDRAGIADWLHRFEVTTTMIQVAGAIPVRISEGDLEGVVIGPDRRLLGLSRTDLVPDGVIGQPLDVQAVPGLAEPLRAALSGEQQPERLYARGRADDSIVMAVPVRDTANEQVVGVLVLSLVVPTLPALLGQLAPVLGLSLLAFTAVAGITGTVFGYLATRGLVHRLHRLAAATLAWRQGELAVQVDDRSRDELGQLTERLNYMARQLQHLLDMRRELTLVEERNRIARDLHDSAKQQAFAASAQLSAARTLLARDPAAAVGPLEAAERLMDDVRQELTNLIAELRPAALADQDLEAAVRAHVGAWSRQQGLAPTIRVQGKRSLPLEIEQPVYRMVQEALANIARHSQAEAVEIELDYASDQLRCSVSDDGQGFDPAAPHRGTGLRSMRERAALLGGTLSVDSRIGHGTRLIVAIPVDSTRINDEERRFE